MQVYQSDFTVQDKADQSPVTAADLAAHQVIQRELELLTPNIPVLSEESFDNIATDVWRSWQTYWLVDPLDGTKEFIKRNGEFTVNIALIHQHQAILGSVHVPVSGVSYLGSSEFGAYKLENADRELSVSKKLQVNACARDKLIIVASRSHPSPKLKDYLLQMGTHELQHIGSSLKFCLIAEGAADIYPRFGPTCEWDTAAGHAVATAAGAKVVCFNGETLGYNQKDSILNPDFIVSV